MSNGIFRLNRNISRKAQMEVKNIHFQRLHQFIQASYMNFDPRNIRPGLLAHIGVEKDDVVLSRTA